MSTVPASFRWLAAASLAFVSLVSAGCSSDSAAIVGPSQRGASSTASIVGQVNGASSSSASVQTSSARNGIRVTVVGTSITATTDASGRFTLSGIPTGNGNVALRFQGQGIDATLQISGLTPGQTLQISVQLSGNNATLDDDDDNEGDGDQDEVEFTGAIDSIADPTLVVAGRTVVTDSSTRITDGGADTTLSALTVGMMVEVEGALQADGSVLAERIKVVNGDGDQDDGEDDDGDEEEDLV